MFFYFFLEILNPKKSCLRIYYWTLLTKDILNSVRMCRANQPAVLVCR
jgi:hypothetical protein